MTCAPRRRNIKVTQTILRAYFMSDLFQVLGGFLLPLALRELSIFYVVSLPQSLHG